MPWHLGSGTVPAVPSSGQLVVGRIEDVDQA